MGDVDLELGLNDGLAVLDVADLDLELGCPGVELVHAGVQNVERIAHGSVCRQFVYGSLGWQILVGVLVWRVVAGVMVWLVHVR